MPYVKQERRADLDRVVNAMVELLRDKHGEIDFTVFDTCNKFDTLLHSIVDHIIYNTSEESRKKFAEMFSVDIPDYDKNKVLKLIRDTNIEFNGDFNYVLFKLAKYHVKPNYNSYKMFIAMLEYMVRFLSGRDVFQLILNFCGELSECATEIRRRILSNYEDKAILRNGDV